MIIIEPNEALRKSRQESVFARHEFAKALITFVSSQEEAVKSLGKPESDDRVMIAGGYTYAEQFIKQINASNARAAAPLGKRR